MHDREFQVSQRHVLLPRGQQKIFCKAQTTSNVDVKLAEPKNEAENDAVASFSNNGIWIGVVRDFTKLPEHSWLYASNYVALMFDKWYPEEPNNYGF